MFEINQTMRVNPDPHHGRRLPQQHERHPEEEGDEEQPQRQPPPPSKEPDKGLRLDIRI